jgi:tetratricopeptide (TPR) repeat protein
MNREDIINIIIKEINAKKYLEIGVFDGINFSKIKCQQKTGVDPCKDYPADYHLTSDEFFNQNKETFDVIFIDGLHHSDQVYKDINNSLKFLSKNGYIICHDLNPVKEEHQTIPFKGGCWNGDCWKAFVKLRQENDNLEMYVVNTDHGCGIIKKGKQKLLEKNIIFDWANFNKNKKEWLNLIEVEDFYDKFKYNIKDLLYIFLNNPNDPKINYTLGLNYEKIGQTASALSYYLRAAERSDDNLFQYECLLKSAFCFEKQGCRNFTIKGLLQHALALQPKRPEAYYLLSKFYEKENKDGSWQDCYTIASIGEKNADLNCHPLNTNVGYPGEYGLIFQKAVSSWWCGLCEESRTLFKKLYYTYELENEFKQLVINNLKFLKIEI